MTRADLSAKDAILASALARGVSQAQAAREAGLGERTVRRRLDDPQFLDLVRQARDELVIRTTDRLAGLVDSAIDTLSDLVAGDEAPPAVRLRAAVAVLNAHRVARDATELENRLRTLEAELLSEAERAEGWAAG